MDIKYNIEDIFKAVPFDSCSDKGREMLLRSELPVKLFRSGDEILDTDGCVCVILAGSVLVTPHSGGQQVHLNRLSVGNCFGVSSVFSEDQHVQTIITAAANCALVFISRVLIERLVMEDSEFSLGYIRFLTGRIRHLNSCIGAFTAPDAVAKLAVYLLQNSHNESTVRIPSMSELAKTLDIGRASLYRALDNLTENGVVEKIGSALVILDEYKLKKSGGIIK